nr:MAG TPA: hypothetical protein [Caudoviricetes sp.]
MNTICIVEQPLEIKEWQGQRVITFKDVDRVHQRPDGTAGRNFRQNRKRFILNEDFFEISPDEIRRNKIMEVSNALKRSMILLTESGYLMLAKSLTDDLAWDVQRALVNNYFRRRQPVQQQLPVPPTRKTWNGNPVMTIKDVALMTKCSQSEIRYWLDQCFACGVLLSGEYLVRYKQENNISGYSGSKLIVLYRHDVESILLKSGIKEDFKVWLDGYFIPTCAIGHGDMRFAVKQASLLYKIAREIKDPVVKEMNLKAVTALLIDIGLWTEKHAGFNGVTANWDESSLEGWNKRQVMLNAKRYWPLD